MSQIGLVGLGLVGSALAERLLAAGHTVVGYDIDQLRREQFAQQGGDSANSPQEVAKLVELCLLSLPTSDIVSQVLRELAPHLNGKIVLDTTTGEPESTAQLGRDLARLGVTYLDATIVGSSKQVRAGEVIVLVGGEESAYRDCCPLIECFARQIFYLGEVGSGARMKLVVNLVLGLNRAVLAEGLTFAQCCGIDPARALEVLRAGMSYSRVMDTKGHKMLQRNFEVEAKLSQHHKDVGLMLNAAQLAGCELPLTQVHDRLLSMAELAGFGDSDNSAIIAAFERLRDDAISRPAD